MCKQLAVTKDDFNDYVVEYLCNYRKIKVRELYCSVMLRFLSQFLVLLLLLLNACLNIHLYTAFSVFFLPHITYEPCPCVESAVFPSKVERLLRVREHLGTTQKPQMPKTPPAVLAGHAFSTAPC